MTRAPRTSSDRHADLTEQALDWLVRLNAGDADGGHAASYRDWRSTSAAHAAAAEEAERLWRDLGDLPRPPDVPRVDPGRIPPAERAVPRRAVLAGALAAGLAAVAVGGSGALGPLSGLYADHATGVGERRDVALPDGSTLSLDAASSASVDFTRAARRIVLHEGRAVVEVRPDPSRPLTVAAAGGEARALGTVFEVARIGEGAQVTVLEGRVEVRPPGPGAAARLGRGEAARYRAASGMTVRPAAADGGAAAAWRRGKLIVDGEPLAQVVEVASRYRRTPIAILDDRAAALEVTGVFELSDVDGLLAAIEESLPVSVHRLPFLTVIR